MNIFPAPANIAVKSDDYQGLQAKQTCLRACQHKVAIVKKEVGEG